ncbi:hypothetical protein [Streptomyces sp. NPDC101150]|uniref:SCO2400 family protein n=1 Tax=Streptomyces sp. NPDC101150 TaxID=3366114 RepID=UPI00382755E7
MDYCSSCRRNLNGALVCPGCGDYAPDIAPPAHRPHRAAAAPAAWETWPGADVPAPGPRQGAARSVAAPMVGDVSEDVVTEASEAGSPDGSGATAATGQGRAARRRQLARWKKHRRRAVAATAFALVGGGLTVSMLQNKPSQTHAASSPEPESVGTPRTETAASASKEPDSGDSRRLDSRPSRGAHRQQDAHRQQNTAAAPQHTTMTVRQPKTATATHPLAAPSATPHSTPPPAQQAPAGHPAVTAPATSAPAPAGPSDTAPSSEAPASTAPSAPAADQTQPTHLCLLGVVCIGS